MSTGNQHAGPSRLDKAEQTTKAIGILGFGAISIVILWISIPLIIFKLFGNPEHPEHVGTLGDMFGSVNALFAGFAFLLLIWSVRQSNKAIEIQQKDLKLQQQELRESRDVLKDQAESQEKMIEAIAELSKQTMMSSYVAANSALLHSAQVRVQIDSDRSMGGRSELKRSHTEKHFIGLLSQYAHKVETRLYAEGLLDEQGDEADSSNE